MSEQHDVTTTSTDSKATAVLNDGIVTVTYRDGEENPVWQLPLAEFTFNHVHNTEIPVAKEDRYKILLWKEVDENVLMVYTKGTTIKCLYTTQNGAHLRLIDRANKVLKVSLNKRYLKIVWFGGIRNTFNSEITDCKLVIDDQVSQSFDMPVSRRLIKDSDRFGKKFITTFKFKTSDFLRENAEINCMIKVHLTINGFDTAYSLSMKQDAIKDRREYYIPMNSIYYRGFALHLRRSLNGNLVLVRRPMEKVEYTHKFRFFENPATSCFLYYLGKVVSFISRKKCYLLYEKFSEKTEEGVFELFKYLSQVRKTNSYFIIDSSSADYPIVKDTDRVVKKYSLKYYWLLFTSQYCISTDSPTHLNILRSNNHFLRKNMIQDKKFIFLQHGITYMKFHGKNSPYCSGKEAEPYYMVVDSEKELKICSEMLNIDSSRFIKAGIPIFDKISYKHITPQSPDYVAIMLTWKPYEEYLTDFEQSTYYKTIRSIYNTLSKYLPSNRIIIISHPKVASLLQNTHLASTVWNHPISEALDITKLLITDYSSVCYNTFYQGGGVIFFQEDLDFYEEQNGPLIPQPDEYIGERVFSIQELDALLQSGICNQTINLNCFRTAEHERRYSTINEFHDGQNIQRICKELTERHII